MLTHGGYEGVKKRCGIMGPGTRLGMPLKTVGWHIIAAYALYRAIEERPVGNG
jgi:hypothetical protein